MLHSFMDVELEIGPGVLVPRQETELLGRSALTLIADIDSPLVIDMCCGSGNLALGIASARAGAQVFASDLTPETVTHARHNTDRLGLSNRVTVVQGDMFSGLAGRDLEGTIDLIVCNPPYISTAKLETESAHLLENEPREAFDAGPYGIAFQQRLIADAAPYLRSGGWLAFEFGAGQDRQAKALLARARAYAAPTFVADEAGVLRVALVQKLST
jgi:release factor glutamine methyltransferase